MSTGVKGSDVYSSTGNALLDLNVKCVRGVSEDALQESVTKLVTLGNGSIVDLTVLAFHTRNVRGGKGERAIFNQLLRNLHLSHPYVVLAVLPLIPHYGCWFDLLALVGRSRADCPVDVYDEVVNIFVKQLRVDEATPIGDNITLVGKWAPREDSPYSHLAKAIAQKLFADTPYFSSRMKKYRTLISILNARLKTIETFMCADDWSSIVPADVPGRAGKIYNRALLNLPTTYRPKMKDAEDEDGNVKDSMYRYPDNKGRMACREKFVTHFAKAAKGLAKVNGADTIFPHELIKKIASCEMSEDEANHLLGVWRGMVEKAKSGGGLRRSIFMSDFSGSMSQTSTGDTPYWVSMALGLLGAEACSAEFKNRLMTFDSDPQWHTFSEDANIFKRVRTIQESRLGQGLSTDFQKAMDLVLKTLKDNRVLPGQEPENLIVLTDMGWDSACGSSEASSYTGNRYRHVVKTEEWQTHLEMIQESFKRAGEDMWGPGKGFVPPRIVIWNLADSYSDDHHATAETPGVAMLSGWSPSQFEILQKEGPRQMTAYEVLRCELDNPRYDRVRERVLSVL